MVYMTPGYVNARARPFPMIRTLSSSGGTHNHPMLLSETLSRPFHLSPLPDPRLHHQSRKLSPPAPQRQRGAKSVHQSPPRRARARYSPRRMLTLAHNGACGAYMPSSWQSALQPQRLTMRVGKMAKALTYQPLYHQQGREVMLTGLMTRRLMPWTSDRGLFHDRAGNR